ncbi:MAG: hypothetical protein F4Z66_06250 [Gammaproteobacteria bacterium]|nr:hypothetical protein [Gammaproteobacteria bacterium]
MPVSSEGFNSNQREFELLIAFAEERIPDTTHVVLVETKAYTCWNSRQLDLKVTRLQEIFDNQYVDLNLVKPHFVLLFNQRPSGIKQGFVNEWSCWMKNYHTIPTG